MDLLQAAVYVLQRSGVPMSTRDVAQSVVKADLVRIDPLLSLDEVTEDLYNACTASVEPVCEIDDHVFALTEWAIQDPPGDVRVSSVGVPAMTPSGTSRSAAEVEQDLRIELPDPDVKPEPLSDHSSLAGIGALLQHEPEYPFLAHFQETLRMLLLWGVICVVAGGTVLVVLGEPWRWAGIIWLVLGLLQSAFGAYQLRKNALSDQAVTAGVLNKRMVSTRVAAHRIVSRIALVTGSLLLILGLILGLLSGLDVSVHSIGLALFSEGLMALVLVALDWWYGGGEIGSRE